MAIVARPSYVAGPNAGATNDASGAVHRGEPSSRIENSFYPLSQADLERLREVYQIDCESFDHILPLLIEKLLTYLRTMKLSMSSSLK